MHACMHWLYTGEGNDVSPFSMALPTSRGHVISFSMNSVACLMNGNRDSNGKSRIYHQAMNQERGYAIKMSSNAQQME